MTRVNLVDPELLCDQHLLAEHREIVRIPNQLLAGKLKYEYDDRPEFYVRGKGHVKFFTNKLRWLYLRYEAVYEECKARGFNVTYMWPKFVMFHSLDHWNDWQPDNQAIRLSTRWVAEKTPKKWRYTPHVN